MLNLQFTGNVTRDAELRSTQDGTSVCSFTVAVNRKYKDKEDTTFIRVTTWRKTAENWC